MMFAPAAAQDYLHRWTLGDHGYRVNRFGLGDRSLRVPRFGYRTILALLRARMTVRWCRDPVGRPLQNWVTVGAEITSGNEEKGRAPKRTALVFANSLTTGTTRSA